MIREHFQNLYLYGNAFGGGNLKYFTNGYGKQTILIREWKKSVT